MAETNPLPIGETPTPKPPEPPKPQAAPTKEAPSKPLNFQAAIDNVANIENHVMTFKGRPGMNPFMWVRDNINPLKERYDRGERSLELYALMAGMKKVDPVAPSNKEVSQKALEKQREARRNAPKPIA